MTKDRVAKKYDNKRPPEWQVQTESNSCFPTTPRPFSVNLAAQKGAKGEAMVIDGSCPIEEKRAKKFRQIDRNNRANVGKKGQMTIYSLELTLCYHVAKCAAKNNERLSYPME